VTDEDSKKRSLYMTSEVATELHQQKKNVIQKRMEERIALEEEKLDRRRAKQEQQLAKVAKKKALKRDAKDSERSLALACISLETAIEEEADDSIVELRSQRLRESWDNSRKAWALLSRTRRKERDRHLRRRAKGLLGL